MIFRKLRGLFAEQFSIPEENITEDAGLVDDLGLDLVELAMALEGVFDLDKIDDLSNIETVEDLIDFLQRELDM